MNTRNFNVFSAVLIILIILGAAGAIGIAYYGLKESPSTPAIPATTAPTTTGLAPETYHVGLSSSTVTDVVWPSNQELTTGVSSSASIPTTASPATPSVASHPSSTTGNQILDTYLNAYQKVQQNKEAYKEVLFKATIYQSLPLRDFVGGLDIRINPDIYNILDQTNYRAVFCYRNQTVDKGLLFHSKRGDTLEYYENLYSQIRTTLREWEPTIFADLKDIFFPQSSLNRTPIFQDAAYVTKNEILELNMRYSNLKDQSDNNLFVGYTFDAETLYVANSLECLKRMIDAHEPTLEP
ncbi:MAG: hypothetical protein HY813_00435 [Candidatus Portnoybacteria bacterium]|nr:hypothetical protein [Candidatus Portnoybacteria bacterium]